jgi:hypothetical protein
MTIVYITWLLLNPGALHDTGSRTPHVWLRSYAQKTPASEPSPILPALILREPSTMPVEPWRASNVWPGLGADFNPGHALPTLSLGIGTNARGGTYWYASAHCMMQDLGHLTTMARNLEASSGRDADGGPTHPGHTLGRCFRWRECPNPFQRQL